MADMVRVDVNTEIEAYPVLGIREWAEGMYPGTDLHVPAEMLERLDRAERAVEQAQYEIMSYLAERYPSYSDIREWVAERASLRDE